MRTILAALLLVGCAQPAQELTIGEVLADPARYDEQTIELSGEVTDAMGLFNVGVYTMKDDTGEIRVTTSQGLPATGTKLLLRGRVQSGVTLGGRHYGVTLSEGERLYIEPE